jgi:poly(3-hydroxybutyrate) depolymerase
VYLSVPVGYPAKNGKVILLLHGAGSSPANMEAVSGMNGVAAAKGLLVATLLTLPVRGQSTGWNAGGCCDAGLVSKADDVGYVAAAVALIRSRFRVPAANITIVGYSNGGMLGYRVICERPGLVGRLAAFHATRFQACRGGVSTPPTRLLDVQGTADTTVPLAGIRHRFPAVLAAFTGAGVRAGCARYVKLPVYRTHHRIDPTRFVWVGRRCAAPASLWVVRGLTHQWTRSALVDETATAVRFAAAR